MLNEVSLGSWRPPEKADTLIDEHMQRLLFFMYLFVLIVFLMKENNHISVLKKQMKNL